MDRSVTTFIEDLASKSPAPGGGSASALAGAVGAALASMVANLTLGREKFKDSEPLMLEIVEDSKRLQESLSSLVVEDTEAYNGVSAVFKMPRTTEEEKAARSEALQNALKYATKVPFSIMEEALSGLRLHKRAWGNINPSVVSDTGVGALCLKTALMGAYLNVKINLGSIKDDDFVREYEEKAKTLLDEGMSIADELYGEVLKQM